MSRAIAYFITWTTYGTRLHGDARGTVDREHNRYGTPRVTPNAARERFEREELKHPPIVLSPEGREIVDRTIRGHAAHRGWILHALNVRSNHVHLVAKAPELVSPETIMGQFKAWSSRRLREAGIVAESTRVWTPHGSTKHVFEADDLMSAIKYVVELQDVRERFERVQRS